MTKEHPHNHDYLIEEVIHDLKLKGIRITPQRHAILTYMVNSHRHPTVEEIYLDLLPDYPGMSLATVYNNLRTFVNEGLVKELKISGSTSHYDFIAHDHHHVICENCGRIADFNFAEIKKVEQAAQSQTGYLIYHTNLEVHGLCPTCQSAIQSTL
ncbi:Fur family transcriptional regulator [Fundicoccus sp. Sow4_F4]|uniref:Fur family transcriptional regulator n=1 Tax=Fundicoccus sp. Sow4_F4 TaxID=3438783 RepID=UPI003F90F55F